MATYKKRQFSRTSKLLELTELELLQVAFAAGSLLIIWAFGMFSRQQQTILTEKAIKIQEDFIKREEAFRVKPRLLFFGPYIDNNILSLRVKNVGRGYAFDIKLKIAVDTWLSKKDSRSISVNLGNVPSNPEPAHFPTKISGEDIQKDSKGEIIIWGTMMDEEENPVQIDKQYISVKGILGKDTEEKPDKTSKE